jgi:hypothetical protein
MPSLIKDKTTPELQRSLDRTIRALSNKDLLPRSVTFYKRRRELIEAEFKRRGK